MFLYIDLMMYRPPSVHTGVLVNSMVKVLDQCLIHSQCIYLLGDLNVDFNESPNVLTNLLESYSLVNVVKGPNCFKSVEHPSHINVI